MELKRSILPVLAFYLLGQKYIIEGGLGKGSFGEVKLCRERSSGNMFAAKIIDLKRIRNRVCLVYKCNI